MWLPRTSRGYPWLFEKSIILTFINWSWGALVYVCIDLFGLHGSFRVRGGFAIIWVRRKWSVYLNWVILLGLWGMVFQLRDFLKKDRTWFNSRINRSKFNTNKPSKWKVDTRKISYIHGRHSNIQLYSRQLGKNNLIVAQFFMNVCQFIWRKYCLCIQALYVMRVIEWI